MASSLPISIEAGKVVVYEGVSVNGITVQDEEMFGVVDLAGTGSAWAEGDVVLFIPKTAKARFRHSGTWYYLLLEDDVLFKETVLP